MSGMDYKPLNRKARQIRLLHFERYQDSSSLECQLIHTSLAYYSEGTQPFEGLGCFFRRAFTLSDRFTAPFVALSYVWGDSALTCDITIDGQPAKITASLNEALRAVLRNTNYRAIWADAVCINQTDKQEKSWQVRMMATVYARANTVICWLGPASHDGSFAIETLEKLQRQIPWSLDTAILKARSTGALPARLEETISSIASDTQRWNVLASFSHRKYWSRIWILQQVATARSRLFLCGDKVANDFSYAFALVLWWQARSLSNTHRFSSQCAAMIQTAHILEAQKHDPAISSLNEYNFRSFFFLLTGTGILNAPDPRDRVFALLNLAVNRSTLDIRADYSKDLRTTFWLTARTLLANETLLVLNIAAAQVSIAKCNGLPSWVPDWSKPYGNAMDCVLYHASHQSHRQSGKSLAAISSLQVGQPLALTAYTIGTISKLHTHYNQGAQSTTASYIVPDTRFDNWLGSVEATTWNEASVLTPVTPREEIILRTLVGNIIKDRVRLGKGPFDFYNKMRTAESLRTGDEVARQTDTNDHSITNSGIIPSG